MKRMKKMILLLGVLALVLGGYTLLNRQQETASVQEENGSFALTAQTADDLTGLEWTKDEESFSFTRENGAWKRADNAAYPVEQSAVDQLVDQLIALEATRKLDNVTDAAMYGLAEPAFSVTAHWSDGTSTTYQMGDETPFRDGYYLALSDQTQTAYTVSSSLSAMFSKTMDDFAAMEDIPAVAEVTRLTIGDTFDASYKEESATINASQHWYAADGRALDGVDDLVTDAKAITWSGLAEAVATDAQLTEWKLDEANAVALTQYDGEESATILFGTTDENGDYYARLPESAMVYTVAADSVNSLLKASPESMISLALAETAYADLQEAVFTVGDVTRTVVPPAETAEDETEQATEDPGEELWKKFTSLKANEHAADTEAGETLLTVSVTAKAGIHASFTFKAYNADSYMVTDGERAMLTDAAKVDTLIRTIKSMK